MLFLNEHFLLHNKTAQRLYHDFAAPMPVIDYHCHLPPDQIAEDKIFENITQAWLYGDHYKWRAMRTAGVDESYCTGSRSDWEKFEQWAGVVPYTLRNPLYHWTHLELQRYFEVHQLLNVETAKQIYARCSETLATPQFSVRNLLRKMKVQVVCTTDDPTDDLVHHKAIAASEFEIKILPSFRPDKAIKVEDVAAFNQYIAALEKASNKSVTTLNDFREALKSRHDFFAEMGCAVADHGLEQLHADDYTEQDLQRAFHLLRSGNMVDAKDAAAFKSAMLELFAEWNFERGWVQQYHLGAMRNNNSRALRQLGPDTGWDSIGDYRQGLALSRFLDRLNSKGKLAKTILYNLNPADNELMATMCGNFNDGTVRGKVQWGSGWWFLDQKDGMTNQLNALSNMGLISCFVGMLTDSRSFLSYPRHEYFRRILCNLFGEEIEQGLLPNDIDWTGKIIQDICYRNALAYFGW